MKLWSDGSGLAFAGNAVGVAVQRRPVARRPGVQRRGTCCLGRRAVGVVRSRRCWCDGNRHYRCRSSRSRGWRSDSWSGRCRGRRRHNRSRLDDGGCRLRCRCRNDRRLLICWSELSRAVPQDPGHRVVLCPGNPKAVRGLHRNLPGNVFAPKALVRRQPRGCVAVALIHVGRTVCRLQVQGVIGEGCPLLYGQLLCALLPGVAKGNNMVDLDGAAGGSPS